MEKKWSVYIVRCADDTLYTGVALDVEKRVLAHNEAKTGAKYTKSRRPVTLLYTENGFTRGEALSREVVLKKMPRQAKISLLKTRQKAIL